MGHDPKLVKDEDRIEQLRRNLPDWIKRLESKMSDLRAKYTKNKEQINETLHDPDVSCFCFRGGPLGDGGCGAEPDAEPAAHAAWHTRADTARADDGPADTTNDAARNASRARTSSARTAWAKT